ncbi:AAA family ATPase [Citrobacter koseri]|uniref:AAA family ATPase n=1 Tax=Citrobacter koseri TaxID=545 RepID=UPI001C6F1A8A|nr:AAA family ATPase [Citrobacter koseri]
MGIIHTPNQFISVHGFAGTGKSYMTKSAADFLKEQGVHVTSLAPYGSQVKALQAEGWNLAHSSLSSGPQIKKLAPAQ